MPIYSTGPLLQAKEVDLLALKILNNEAEEQDVTITLYLLNGTKQIHTQRQLLAKPYCLTSENLSINWIPEFEVQFACQSSKIMLAVFGLNSQSGELIAANCLHHKDLIALD